MDDDLAQAVELAKALTLTRRGDHITDFAQPLILWAGVYGRGVGFTTREVIDELRSGDPPPEPARRVFERRNGIAPNGGVMRCAPISIARRRNPKIMILGTAMTCAVTRYSPTCQWSCIIVNAIIHQLLHGLSADAHAIMHVATNDGCPDLQNIAQQDAIPPTIPPMTTYPTTSKAPSSTTPRPPSPTGTGASPTGSTRDQRHPTTDPKRRNARLHSPSTKTGYTAQWPAEAFGPVTTTPRKSSTSSRTSGTTSTSKTGPRS